MYTWRSQPPSWLQSVLQFRLAVLVAALILLAKTTIAYADGPGDLDSTFNDTGIATNTVISSWQEFYSLMVQPNNHILTVGTTGNINLDAKALLFRYTPEGQLDAAFNGTGVVTTTIGNWNTAYAATFDSDQKIVTVGVSNNSFTVARYESNGSPDFTFNSTGVITTSFGAGSSSALAVYLQPDNGLVAAGIYNQFLALAHYTNAGILDTSINGTGIITEPHNRPLSASLLGMAFQPDGKLLEWGAVDFTPMPQIFISRYTASGKPDLTFNSTGLVTTTLGNNLYHLYRYTVALQPDGKIIASGSAARVSDSLNDLIVIRYLPDGSLDSTFNGTGIVTTSLTAGSLTGLGVAVQPDGKIVTGGVINEQGNNWDAFVARYTFSGDMDTTFKGTGIVTTSITPGSDEAVLDIALQDDGKIVMTGTYSDPVKGTAGFFIARYLGTTLPPALPALTVAKSTNVTAAEIGQPLTYTYRLTNTGNLTLTNLAAYDDPLGSVPLTITTLAPTASLAALLVYTPTTADLGQPLVNTFTVTATVPGYPSVMATSVLQIPVQDTLPPLFPTNSLITPTQTISLTTRRPQFLWQAATDNSSVVSYTLFLTGPGLQTIQSFTTSQPAYTPITSLSPGAYTWTVRAHDLAGNNATAMPPAQFAIKPNTSQVRKLYLPLLIKP